MSRMLPDPESDHEADGFAEDLVTLPRAELDALRAIAEGRAGNGRDRSSPSPRADPATLEELAGRERRIAEREQALRDAIRDRELAVALAGKPLVGGAAEQLIKLWRDDFDVCEEGGEYRIISRDGRPVTKAVADRLTRPEFAHFCLPSSRGGTGSREGPRDASVAPPAPRTLGEAIVAQWRAAAAQRAGNLATPIGLSRRR